MSTGLGRSLGPRLATHRIAFVGAGLAAVAYGVIAVIDDRPLIGSLIAGVAVFIGWAAGRELDPDRSHVAVWAMPIAFVALVYDMPSLVASAVAVLALRVVAGTVGRPVAWIDIGVLAFVGYAAGSQQVLWLAGLAIAIWLLSAPEVGSLRYVAVVVLAIGLLAGAWTTALGTIEITQDAYLLAALGGVVMMLAMTPSDVISETDAGTGTVEASRVGLARKTAGSILMWAAVMGGVAGFWAVSPILAALVATAIAKWFSPGA